MNLIFSWLIACVLLSLSANPSKESLHSVLSISVADNPPTDLQQEWEAIFATTNQQRIRKRLTPLRKDSRLMLAAQGYADLMAA